MTAGDEHRQGPIWYLEGFTEASGPVRRLPILEFPFEIGRRPGLGMTLASNLVSQYHARIDRKGSTLEVRDLGSTNGTFLNGRRLREPQVIEEGDIIHIARFEFRLGRVEDGSEDEILDGTLAVSEELPQLMIERSRFLREMMRQREVLSVFQPIVALPDRQTLGFEALGRGLLEGRHTASGELFRTAASLGAEAELSRLFRAQSVEDCSRLPGEPLIFINTHPSEIGTEELFESLSDFRRRAPDIDAILEIHESAVTSPEMLREIAVFLAELDFGLAYDDFGAGQARLQELASVQPDYLKFDISLIRDIDQAGASRRQVLSSLVTLALELGIAPIAEGIESSAEAKTCHELGFPFGQGFLFGAPTTVDRLQPTAGTSET
jgi:EAL domain-containing protein (putative c-di-GMP-specific phosphodiesterase class I)